MSLQSSRRYLVVVRAGHASLHRRLISENPERNWDCWVSWYVRPPDETLAERYGAGGDNKFEGCLELTGGSLEGLGYEYVLLLDDDLYFDPGEISRFFEICAEQRTFIAQPALCWGSHYSHVLTLWNPTCRVRRVTFVEVMAPCFSRKAFERCSDTFALSKSTYGLDWAWSSKFATTELFAVVDAVKMDHTRPIRPQGGAFYEKLRRMGIDPTEEFAMIKRLFPDTFGGIRTCQQGHVPAGRAGAVGWPFAFWLAERLKVRLHQMTKAGRILRAKVFKCIRSPT